MSQLIFLAPSGGTVTLTNADTASNTNMTLPAVNGTLLYIDSSNTLTVPNLTVTGLPLFTGTTALGLPVGTGTQRPVSPTVGEIRYCTDSGGFFEGYEAGAWRKFTTTALGLYTISYLVVAGGGGSGSGNGGGGGQGGGGGAGGLVSSSFTATPGTVYNAIVGGGGSAVAQGTLSAILVGPVYIENAVGGGYGTNYTASGNAPNGGNGGSGGGAGTSFNGFSASGGSGVSGQGNSGGSAQPFPYSAGAGGGAGGSASGSTAGVGAVSTITGSAITYAAGGGITGATPSANTGNGAGGGPSGGVTGASGLVILSILTANYTGTVTGSPTVTTNGSYTIVKFTSSGTYTA